MAAKAVDNDAVNGNLQNFQLHCDWELLQESKAWMVLKSCQVFQFSRKLYLDLESNSI